MRDSYKQCELSKPVANGVARMISWIPSAAAVCGKIVALKDLETGERTSGWRVENVTEPALAAKLIERNARDYLRTREASDI